MRDDTVANGKSMSRENWKCELEPVNGAYVYGFMLFFFFTYFLPVVIEDNSKT